MKYSFKVCRIIILIFILLFLVGCSIIKPMKEDNKDKVENENMVNLQSYFPIQEGMLYKYQGKGNEFATFTREIKFAKDNLVQIHKNNGGTEVASIYRIGEGEISLLQENPEFYSDTNLLNNIGDKVDVKEIILKDPLEVGKSWDNGNKRREIIAINTQLNVPAGRFYDVVKVKVTYLGHNKDFESYEYYAQNIGLIMLESKGKNYQVTSKLKSYGVLE